MSGKHHAFGPSSLARRAACPGSWRIEKDLPAFETEDANEGTRLHAETAKILSVYAKTGELPKLEDFSEYAAGSAGYVVGVIDQHGGRENCEIHIEEKISFSYAGIEQYNGTPDVVLVFPELVIVIDHKYGHRPVDKAEDNEQGAAYALAAMTMYKRQIAEVHFYNPVIMQKTSCTFDNAPELAKYIMRVIAECKEETAPVIPSESACRYCKGAYYGTCPAVRATAELAVRKAEKLVPLPALSVLPEETLFELAEKCALVGKLEERVLAEVRRRAEKSESKSCGPYVLKSKSGGRKIEDIPRAFELSGMDQTAFLSCCTVSAAKLESLYAKQAKSAGTVKTEKEAKAIFNDKMSEVITVAPPRMELIRRAEA